MRLLTDAAIETVLVFEQGLALDPHLEASRLVDSDDGRRALQRLYDAYLSVGKRYNLPMQMGTPTFRCSPERVARAGLPAGDLERLNRDCVQLFEGRRPAVLAGVLGPAHDAYQPDEALEPEDAYRYHTPQAEALAGAGVDQLFAPTFPSVEESIGVARAMASTGKPFSIGWVLGEDGRLLDGTTLQEAVARVDELYPPSHYMLSCIHPSRAAQALRANPLAHGRVAGLKANTSRRPTAELVQLGRLDTEDPEVFAQELIAVGQEFGLTILGGCCGTDATHLEAIAKNW